MRTLATLTQDELSTFQQFLNARPFTEEEREYWQLCWMAVTQQQVDDINALMPPNHRVEPREKDGTLYINADLLSDSVSSRRLSSIEPIVQDLVWEYINPWEWETDEPPPNWLPYDGTSATIYQPQDLVSHSSLTWVCTVPNCVWEPGVFGWKEVTDGTTVPVWRQPLGAGDAYQVDDEVLYNEKRWACTLADNVWKPGVTGWDEVNPEPPSNEWSAGTSYAVNDEVDYQGSTYRCIQAHTSQVGWEPPNVPALWETIQ